MKHSSNRKSKIENRKFLLCLLPSAYCLLFTAGCDGMTSVRGRITLDGQAVANASVCFTPEGPGQAASGVTDEDGKFTLNTRRAADGVAQGKYRVVVTKGVVTAPAPEAQAPEFGGASGFNPETMMRSADKIERLRSQSEIPAVYRSAATTPLRAEIGRRGPNFVEFDLSSTQK